MSEVSDRDLARLVAKVVWPSVDTDCWLWVGALNSNGYGSFWLDKRTQQAHRVTYQWMIGPIPRGLEVDHLCRIRRCVNPDHLEPVTTKTNVLRGEGLAAGRSRQTHCQYGHALSGSNVNVRPNGTRNCRQCRVEKRYPSLASVAGKDT